MAVGLSPEQKAQRAGKVTASFAPKLLAGDEASIMREWMKLIDHPNYVEEDLSDVWAVQFGHWLEPIALDWWERKTGKALTERGKFHEHPAFPHIGCTLDAYREADNTVIDVKTINSHAKVDQRCAYYAPQMIVQRACVGSDRMALLIVHGGTEPQEWPIEVEPSYEAQVWEKIAEFWLCVEELRPPYELKSVEAPVIQAFREIDMQDSNAWGEHAANWLLHRDGAKAFKTAETELKALMPPDGKRCYGHGIQIARSKAGALTIKPGG